MSVNLRNYKTHRVVDFSGGLNEFDSNFTMADNELQEATNVMLRQGGAVRTRLGCPNYQNQTFLLIDSPIRDARQYTRFNFTRQVLAHAGGAVYIDDDNGEFTAIQSGILSSDGHCRFTQWREAAIYGTKRSAVYAYAPDQVFPSFATNVVRIDLSGTYINISTIFPDNYVTLTAVNSGTGVLGGGFWEYRYTFDMYCGSTFIGETAPLSFINVGSGGGHTSWSSSINVVAPNDAVQISLSANPVVFEAEYSFATIGAINVYRQILPTVGGTTLETVIEPNMALVGSIPRSQFANLGTVLLTDNGLFAGKSIAPLYARATPPPRGRFNVIHKSRLWIGNVQYPTTPTNNAAGTGRYDAFIFTDAPHRVYFSEVNEIGAFQGTSWVEIDPLDGDGVTGMVSFKNKALIVFTANSMWAIAGGDDEIGPGIPDISIENVSTDIGCVAAESIQICDGRLVWLSHRGVYYFDGTVPKPLNSDNIDATLLERPNARYNAPVSMVIPRHAEYWLAHTPEGESYQTLISKFSFKNVSWTRSETEFAISAFFEKKQPDVAPKVYGCVEGTLINSSAILQLEHGGYDFVGGVNSPIEWSWKTKFYDFGIPMIDKKYIAVLVQLESTTTVTMEVDCDNHLEAESFTISLTENDQDIDVDDLIWATDGGVGGDWSDGTTGDEWVGNDVRNALIFLNTKCWGKRIALRFSGESTAEPTEIQAVTFFYDPKEGVRQ